MKIIYPSDVSWPQKDLLEKSLNMDNGDSGEQCGPWPTCLKLFFHTVFIMGKLMKQNVFIILLHIRTTKTTSCQNSIHVFLYSVD
jgi:hypothetical protein